MTIATHYLERGQSEAPCGEVPSLASRDPNVVTCPVCRIVLGVAVTVRTTIRINLVAMHAVPFVCAVCERPHAYITPSAEAAERATRLIHMLGLACEGCVPRGT